RRMPRAVVLVIVRVIPWAALAVVGERQAELVRVQRAGGANGLRELNRQSVAIESRRLHDEARGFNALSGRLRGRLVGVNDSRDDQCARSEGQLDQSKKVPAHFAVSETTPFRGNPAT